MAGATKRTSVMLVVLAIIFIVTAIILALAGVQRRGPTQHEDFAKSKPIKGVQIDTTTTTTIPTTITTTTTTTTTTTIPTTNTTTTQPTTTSVSPSTPKLPPPPPPTTTPYDTTTSTTPQAPPATTITTEDTTSVQTTDTTVVTTPQPLPPQPAESTPLITTTDVSTTTPLPSPQTTTNITSEPSQPPPTSVSESSSTTTQASESSTPSTATTPPPTTSPSTTTAITSPPPTQPLTTTPYSDLTTTNTSDATQPHTTSSMSPSSNPTSDPSTTPELSSPVSQPQTTEEPTSTPSEPPTPTTLTTETIEETVTSESSVASSYSSTSTTTTTSLSSTTPSMTTLCPPPAAPQTEDVCTTPACKTLAARMLHMMDHSQEQPCEDFYQYACGGVTNDPFLDPENRQKVTNGLILDNLKDLSSDDPFLGPVKVFYDSCIAAEQVTHNKTVRRSNAKAAFNNLISAFDDGSVAEDFTLILAEMMKIHFAPFFDLLLDVAEDGTDKFVLKLTPPVLPSPFSKDEAWAMCYGLHLSHTEEALHSGSASYDVNEEYDKYSECIESSDGLRARLRLMRHAVEELDLFNGTTLDDEFKNLERLLGALHSMLPSKPDFREGHLNRNFKNVMLSSLEQEFNFTNFKVEWKKLVEELLGQRVDPDSVTIHIYFFDYLHEAFNRIDYEQPAHLQRILLLLLAERFYTDLIEPAEHNLGKPEYCLHVTTELLGDFVSTLYLDNVPDLQDRQQKMEEMIRTNKLVAEAELMHGSSVEPNAKAMWLNKLSAMRGEVPDPKNTSLYLLQGLSETTLTDNFVDNCLILLRRYRSLMYQQYHDSPSDPAVLWSHFLRPFSSRGMSLYASNTFLIPYAAMEAPLFFQDVPDYLNYAGIGQMIAHELMHGFDGTGIQYNGTYRQTLEGNRYFLLISECLANQYRTRQSQTAASGLTANFTLGRLPLNEVLADSGAVRLAWDAYEHSISSSQQGSMHGQRLPWLGLKPQQLYFLRIAQTHCSATSDIHMLSLMENEHLPPRLRVNMMLGNEPRFTKAFGCPAAPHQCPYVLG